MSSPTDLDELVDSHFRANTNVCPERHRFPHSLVWTPIPIITWLFPFIGHIGITNMTGIIYDFAAAYTIQEDSMAFGWPTMYCILDLTQISSSDLWDKAVYEANEVYKQRVHNLFCDNCHSHVARALNEMQYEGRSNWTMFSALWLFFSKARYVSAKHCFYSLLPFFLIVALIVGITLASTLS